MLELLVGQTNMRCNTSNLTREQRFQISKFLSKKLTTGSWNPRLRRFEIDKYYYIWESNVLVIPTAFTDLLEEHLRVNRTPCVKIPQRIWNSPETEIPIADGFTDRPHQVKPINFLVDNPSPMRCCAMQPGKGKTYSALKTANRLGKNFAVMVSGMTGQWYKEVLEKTKLTEDEVYIIQGVDTIRKLFKKYDDVKIKSYVCSVETIREWIKYGSAYHDLPRWHEFCQLKGVGIKVIDEAHRHFFATCMIDFSSNIEHNIYLSATFGVSCRSTAKIFNRVFNNNIVYKPEKRDNYIKSIGLSYTGFVPVKKCLTPRGLSWTKYEQFILSKKEFTDEYFDKVIKKLARLYIDPLPKKFKTLMFFSTINMCDEMLARLQKMFPDKKITTYLGRDSDDVLVDNDIIISTHKKCSTGVDIKQLGLTINTVSMNADHLIEQVQGRLRKLPCDTTPIYVDIFDVMIPNAVNHFKNRRAVLKSISKIFEEFSLD